jgi:two-component system sensor histidine kinase TtrS
MAQAMRERQNALDHAGRLATLGEMASAIAHELKQPLAAIGNFARGMDRRVVAGRLEPAALREGCHGIVVESARATATIDRIRGFARKNVGAMRSVDLAGLVREAADLFGVAHPEARTRWSDTGGPAPVQADPLQIQQVTVNLLMNAYDAQKAAGNLHEPIEIVLSRQGRGYQVTVRDRGSGLKDEDIPRLFEPFFTTKPHGLGLGLTLSSGIIEAHGGTLGLSRDADRVCASFWLPAEDTHE